MLDLDLAHVMKEGGAKAVFALALLHVERWRSDAMAVLNVRASADGESRRLACTVGEKRWDRSHQCVSQMIDK